MGTTDPTEANRGTHGASLASEATAMIDVREYWNFDDPAQSYLTFMALRETQTDASQIADIDAQVARALGLQGKFEEAHKVLDSIQGNWSYLNDRARASYQIERGRVFRSSGNAVAARECFERARDTTALDLEIDALHMLAFVSDPDEARRYNEEALALTEVTDNPWALRWRGTLFNNMAWDLHAAEQFEQALEKFEQAVEARKSTNDVKRLRVAQWCRARCLRSLHRYEEALRVLGALENEDNDEFFAEEMGENLYSLGRTEEARPWFERTFQILSQDSSQVGTERLNRLEKLSGVSTDV
jgi:tetratricopeptide (TPR) repeat protein